MQLVPNMDYHLNGKAALEVFIKPPCSSMNSGFKSSPLRKRLRVFSSSWTKGLKSPRCMIMALYIGSLLPFTKSSEVKNTAHVHDLVPVLE